MIDYNFQQQLIAAIQKEYPIMESLNDPVADGSVYRLDSTKHGDKAVWVAIRGWEFKGNLYYSASYGSWRDGTQHEIKSFDKKVITKEFNAVQQKATKETQERLENEKRLKHDLCKKKWSPIFYSLNTESDVHPYLKNKQIDSNFLGRVTSKGVLIVPAFNHKGEFVGGQQIFLDPETQKYIKRYTSGIEKLGSICPFGDIRKAKYIYICEGFATACSVYMALMDNPEIAVVAVWDTSNVYSGAKCVREVNPKCNLIFAADRDINKDPRLHDIGNKKAKFASNRFNNSIVKMVSFNDGNDTWSDFNDLHQFESIEEVKKQLEISETDFTEVTPLGYKGKINYMFCSDRNMITTFNSTDYTPANLFGIAPEKYWGERYGFVMRDDGPSNVCNIKKVIEGISRDCVAKGVFNLSQVRGTGAWAEQNDIIVNLGDKLYYKEDYKALFRNDINSKYFYEADEGFKVDPTKPLGDSKAMEFVEAFQMLQYKNPGDYIIVLGWIFCAQIFATMKWRPHIWFTGPRGSGKSTILESVKKCIPFAIMTQDSTSAGIRQRLKNNAFPTIYDEAEPNNKKDREKMDSLLTMARQCSTNSGYEVLRGTAGGTVQAYNTNTCFCMGSIQVGQMNEADKSRFFVIEMNKIENQSHQDFSKFMKLIDNAEEMASGLLSRAINIYPEFTKNIETTKEVIKKSRIESRKADQLAPIIAGYYAYFSDGLIKEEFILKTLKDMNFTNSDYEKSNQVDQSENCFNAIFELSIPKHAYTVGQVVQKIIDSDSNMDMSTYNDMLSSFGIQYIKNGGNIFISQYNIQLVSELGKITQFSGYHRVLSRSHRIVETESDSLWINGKAVKGMFLKV